MPGGQFCGESFDGGWELIEEVDWFGVGVYGDFDVDCLSGYSFQNLLGKNVDAGQFLFQLGVSDNVCDIAFGIGGGDGQFDFKEGGIEFGDLLEEE